MAEKIASTGLVRWILWDACLFESSSGPCISSPRVFGWTRFHISDGASGSPGRAIVGVG